MLEGIKLLKHDTVKIKNSVVIYIDPFKIEDEEKADLILVTHEHYDHCSREDISKLMKDDTVIVTVADCQSILNGSKYVKLVSPGDVLEIKGVKINAVPAYNIGKPFHPKENEWVGFVLEVNGKRIYHAGDTDLIPEMQKMTGYNQNFIALLPVGGRFTMDPHEAFEAAKLIKPSIAIPMHWGSIIGSREDAEEFKELCSKAGINCEILDKK